jgi:hypothetical protein
MTLRLTNFFVHLVLSESFSVYDRMLLVTLFKNIDRNFVRTSLCLTPGYNKMSVTEKIKMRNYNLKYCR